MQFHVAFWYVVCYNRNQQLFNFVFVQGEQKMKDLIFDLIPLFSDAFKQTSEGSVASALPVSVSWASVFAFSSVGVSVSPSAWEIVIQAKKTRVRVTRTVKILIMRFMVILLFLSILIFR